MVIELEKLHDEMDFLRALARLGQEAERRISTKRHSVTVTWNTLAANFFSKSQRPIPSASRDDYRRWIRYLAEWAATKGIPSPCKLTRTGSETAIDDLFGESISRDRIQRFYRRVWKTLGWDETIWRTSFDDQPKQQEHYRRLELKEIRRLLRYLSGTNRELHDMVVIGYYTGLRLSDIAELERSEFDAHRQMLRIVPNKVRTRKPHALSIPLVGDALQIVSSGLRRGRYLFSEKTRLRPSRRIVKAFRRCNIRKKGCGRASFHSLRATFISLMDEAGVQPYITDAITGHAAGGMHARYTQPALETLRAAILKAIPPISSRRRRCRRPRSRPA